MRRGESKHKTQTDEHNKAKVIFGPKGQREREREREERENNCIMRSCIIFILHQMIK
jgi:hypothetical protein